MKTIVSLLLALGITIANAQPCIPNGNSLAFNGTSAYVDLGPATNINSVESNITVEAWIYSTAWGFNSAQNSIFCTHGWTNGERGFVLRAGGDGVLSFNIAGLDTSSGTTTWREVESPINTIQLNTWTHVAGTFSGTELKIYVNGVDVGTTSFIGKILGSTYGAKIGKLADDLQSPGRYFNGNIDEVRVWDRVLSATELADSSFKHINPLSNFGLLGYWRMNDGSGSTCTDFGTGFNNGNILGSIWSVNVPFNEVPEAPIISWNGIALVSTETQNIQWNIGGTPIGGATDSIYVPTMNGAYTVIYTNPNGCSSTSLPYLVSTVGIEHAHEYGEVSLWPNPAHKQINVRMKMSKNKTANIFIYDVNQRLVFQKKIENLNEDVVSINTSGFSSGIYRLSVLYSDEIKNIKFQVQ